MEKLHKSIDPQILKDYTDFLLKEGYCDSDVYDDTPTAIDQFLLILNKKK